VLRWNTFPAFSILFVPRYKYYVKCQHCSHRLYFKDLSGCRTLGLCQPHYYYLENHTMRLCHISNPIIHWFVRPLSFYFGERDSSERLYGHYIYILIWTKMNVAYRVLHHNSIIRSFTPSAGDGTLWEMIKVIKYESLRFNLV